MIVTNFFLQLLAAWMILVAVHTAATVIAGASLGVAIREVSFGFGKALLTRGRFTLRVSPLGGYVRFKDTAREGADLVSDAYDHQARWVQSLIALSGPVALIAVALIFHPSSGFSGVVSGFKQILIGAFGPLTQAQTYLGSARGILSQSGFLALLGLVASKVAAFNLIPLSPLNGWQAIVPWVRKDRTAPGKLEQRIANILLWPFLAIVVSWIVAFVYFAWSAAG